MEFFFGGGLNTPNPPLGTPLACMGETRNSKYKSTGRSRGKKSSETLMHRKDNTYYKDLRERDHKDVNGSQQAKESAPLQASVTKFQLHKDRVLFNSLFKTFAMF